MLVRESGGLSSQVTGGGVSSRLVSSKVGVCGRVRARTAVARKAGWSVRLVSIRDPASVLGGGQSEIVMFLFFSLFCAMRTLAQ